MKLTPKQLKQLVREQIEAMAGAPDNIKEQTSSDPKAAHEKWMADTQGESGRTIRAKKHIAEARREISERIAQESEASVRSSYRKVNELLRIGLRELEAAETEESYTLDT